MNNSLSSSQNHRLVLESAKCAICDQDLGIPCAIGEDFEYQTVPDTFLMMQCKSCGLLYLNPRPATESIPIVYPDHYHAFDFSGEKFGLIHSVRQRLEARRLMKWCSDLPNDARILDVGCGDGFHLSILRDFGPSDWRLQGVDTDKRAVECARSRGFDVVHGDVASIASGDKFDLVLLIMTIEHLNHPRETLGNIQQLMNTGGRLAVVTDNADSPDQRLFGDRYWGGYHFPRHTYLFSQKTLRSLGEQLGFEVESIHSALSPVNWTYSVRNLLVDWRAPQLLINCFSLQSKLGLAAFTVLDAILTSINRGAILHATFRKSNSGQADG